ncbi:MAG: hypothetical protein ABJA98_15405 [Acidobacteriota bacterium]
MSTPFRLFGAAALAIGAAFGATTSLAGQTSDPAVQGSAAKPKAAQTAKASTKGFAMPKTPWGDPDLQGVWTSDDMLSIPMERPEQFAGRAELTDEEFAARAKRDQDSLERNRKAVGAFRGDVGTRTFRQTSRVIEPADGRVPPTTPEAQRRVAMRQAARSNAPSSWEDRSLYDRCITRGIMGSTLPVIYGNGNQIFQTPTSVVINYEMVHDTRVIPLDGRPHVGSKIKTYLGDARGHWEGNTLVVETTNFMDDKTGIGVNGGGAPTSEMLKLVERFTRVEAGIQYEAAIEDPKTFTRPWKIGMTLTTQPGYQILPYECHEGNRGLEDMLSAARAYDRAVADAVKNGTPLPPSVWLDGQVGNVYGATPGQVPVNLNETPSR